MSDDVIYIQNWKMSIRDSLRWKQDKEVLKNDPLIRGWRGFSQIFLTTLSCFFESVPKDTSDDDVANVQNLKLTSL